jgi:hypothetical protein
MGYESTVTHNPSKREVMLTLLERSEARVHLDARRSGVVLPERLLRSGNVRLDYGYGLQPPIPDLLVDDEGIRATLSFNRLPVLTFIPWPAVFLIADFDGHGAVWKEDIPADLLEGLQPEAPAARPIPAAPEPVKKTRPSHLKLVK